MSSIEYAAILAGMPQPYLILDNDLTIVGASDAYLKLTSRSRDDIVGRHILEAFPENPDAAGTVEQGPLNVSLRHVLRTGTPHEMAAIQYDIPAPDGGFSQRFWTPVHTPVLGESGRVDYIIQNPMDVTEIVLRAREADARLRVAHHAADLSSWEYEPETDIWRRSHSVDILFGFEPGEGGPVAAPFFARMHPEDLPTVIGSVRNALNSPDQTSLHFDYRIVLPSGDTRFVSSQGEILRTSSGKVRMIGVLMDVTAHRERESALARSVDAQATLLTQKDALLREVNHRVKNSLQLVVSTLRLQARKLRDPVSAEAFDQAILRVRAIISVHERLYRTDNALSVDMSEHLRKLCFDIIGNRQAKVDLDVDPLELPTERAIPVSIIVNELFMAMLPVGIGGARVFLSCHSTSPSEIAICLRGPSFSWKSTDGALELGERLVRSMVEQIGGTFTETFDDDHYSANLTFARVPI